MSGVKTADIPTRKDSFTNGFCVKNTRNLENEKTIGSVQIVGKRNDLKDGNGKGESMKIYQSWKRNKPDTQGYSITVTITYCSSRPEEIEELEKKMPKGMLVMNTDIEPLKEQQPKYPCIDCCSPSERAACCGCQKERQWQERYGNKK